jgi:hypothetical protein
MFRRLTERRAPIKCFRATGKDVGKMAKVKRKGKTVFVALLALIITLGMVAGCVVADRNTRRIGFGETAPVMSRYQGEGNRRGLTFYLMGNHYIVDVTPAFEAAQSLAREWEKIGRAVSEVGDAWAQQMEPKGW